VALSKLKRTAELLGAQPSVPLVALDGMLSQLHESSQWGRYHRPWLSFRRSNRHNVRVTRVAAEVERAHPIAITRVTCQSGIRVTGDVGTYRSNLPEVCAVLPLATLDTKPGLLIGIIAP
jgi:hypothetical protein